MKINFWLCASLYVCMWANLCIYVSVCVFCVCGCIDICVYVYLPVCMFKCLCNMFMSACIYYCYKHKSKSKSESACHFFSQRFVSVLVLSQNFMEARKDVRLCHKWRVCVSNGWRNISKQLLKTYRFSIVFQEIRSYETSIQSCAQLYFLLQTMKEVDGMFATLRFLLSNN